MLIVRVSGPHLLTVTFICECVRPGGGRIGAGKPTAAWDTATEYWSVGGVDALMASKLAIWHRLVCR